jgi:hypothetical protein
MIELIGDGARFVHVIFGFTGLAAFWVPVFAKKGGINHVRFGKIFVYSAYVVLTGSTIVLTTRVAGLLGQGIHPAEQPDRYAFFVFLGYLTFVTFFMVRHGMTVLRHKRDPAAVRSAFNLFLSYGAIAASAALITFAVVFSPSSMIVLLALSPIGLATGSGALRYMSNPPVSPRAWMYEHLGAMFGAGIAFHTAFAVFGSAQLFDLGLTGWAAVIPWVAPAAIGIPATAIWTRRYRRKFGELRAAA